LSLPSILTSPTSPSFPTRRSSDLYGFPLPVFIRSQNKLVRISQLFLEPINNLFLTPWYYVKRLKVVIRIYAKIGPIFTFKLFGRSEEHTSELQSRFDLVCRLLLEK